MCRKIEKLKYSEAKYATDHRDITVVIAVVAKNDEIIVNVSEEYPRSSRFQRVHHPRKVVHREVEH